MTLAMAIGTLSKAIQPIHERDPRAEQNAHDTHATLVDSGSTHPETDSMQKDLSLEADALYILTGSHINEDI